MNKHARTYLIVAAITAAALVIVALFAPREAAAGWLIAFCYVSAFPLGGLALLMIHRLTGGRWGEALEPFLRPLVQSTPLLLLFVIPVLVASPALFPWTRGGSEEITASVRQIYLNVPLYVVRSLVALAGWSILAMIISQAEGRSGRLLAAIGLVFHGIAITFMSLDWMLTVQAPFFSTSFGASVAFTQLLAALALAAVVAPRDRDLPDLSALMLVVTLGITYTDFMAVLVIWYADSPSMVLWFVERIREPWRTLSIVVFIATSLVPIVLLMFARVRASRTALRYIGVCSLAGLAIYQTWLIAPAFGVASIATALLALLAMAAAIAGAIAAGWPQRFSNRWRAAYGR